jgi:radical SAM protein with 4Fe4S-binding SPASM domain
MPPPPLETRHVVTPQGTKAVRALPIHAAERTRSSSHGLGAPTANDARYRPIYVVWELTQACDHACGHCGSRSGRALDDELSTAEALALVDQMAALGVKEVTLIGGEAYLHAGFVDVARRIAQRDMHCSVTTGGRAVDDELAQKMAAAGVITVSVSMEGDEAAHDRIRRQKGSWSRALRAVQALKRAGLRPALNTQVNRWSLPSMGSLVELMIAEGVERWMPIITVPMGRSAENLEMLWQPYELVEVIEQLAGHAQRAREAGILVAPGNTVGYFGPFEHVLRAEFKGQYGGSCGAGRTTMGVEADGTIKGCPGLPTDAYSGGVIREHALETIWERGTALRYTRERTVDDLWGFCRTCYYADVCMAGCTWASHVIMGRPGNNPYCYHRAATLRAQGKRERMVLAEAPRGVPFDHGAFELVLEDVEPGETMP